MQLSVSLERATPVALILSYRRSSSATGVARSVERLRLQPLLLKYPSYQSSLTRDNARQPWAECREHTSSYQSLCQATQL